ncbi:MAG: hypothetical protein ACREEK_16670 [Bradyrhizobium sp.]
MKRFSGMRMKNAALFAIGFLSVNFWLLDNAKCQTSLAPPLSLARPIPAPDVDASPPAIIRASPPTATDDAPPPKATAKRSAPPVAARDAPPPKPAADHDGFTTRVEDEPVAKLPVSPRAAYRPKPKKEADSIAGQPWADSADDVQLRRKLTICRDCK